MNYVLPETEKALTALYTESHRFYHNLDHVHHCFAALDRLRGVMTPHELKKSVVLEVGRMIWFHDAVYDIGPSVKHGENERRSAAMWADSVDAKMLEHNDMMKVWYGINMSAMHTKHQQPAYFTKSQQIFLDIDLCGMGESYHTFMANGDNIREEFAFVPDDAFNAGRANFFKTLVKRPYLYYNHVMRGMYEENTRANINRWLEENA